MRPIIVDSYLSAEGDNWVASYDPYQRIVEIQLKTRTADINIKDTEMGQRVGNIKEHSLIGFNAEDLERLVLDRYNDMLATLGIVSSKYKGWSVNYCEEHNLVLVYGKTEEPVFSVHIERLRLTPEQAKACTEEELQAVIYDLYEVDLIDRGLVQSTHI